MFEHAFIIRLSTAVKYSYYEAFILLTQHTEIILQVEKRKLSFVIRHDYLAEAVFHHSMPPEVYYRQCV